MKTFLVIVTALLTLISLSVSAEAFEVIAVKSSDITPYTDAIEGFRKSCSCNVTELDNGGSTNLVQKILKKSPDAVLTVGTSAFREVSSIKDLPVIYTMVMPSEVNNLKHENIYGVNIDVSPEAAVRTLKDIFPDRKRIGILYDPKNTGAYVREATEISVKQGMKIIARSVRNTSDVPKILAEMEGKIDLFWMLPDVTVITNESVQTLLLFSFENNVPVFTFSRKYVELGAVLSLSINPFDMGVRAGEIAAALSEGKNSSARVNAKKTVLTINRKVAAKMCIHISDETLRRAAVID